MYKHINNCVIHNLKTLELMQTWENYLSKLYQYPVILSSYKLINAMLL